VEKRWKRRFETEDVSIQHVEQMKIETSMRQRSFLTDTVGTTGIEA